MNTDFQPVLLASTAAIAVAHTVLGPDHYLPFAAMGRAFQWSWRRVAVITLLCGAGHIATSVLLGLAGIALGAGLVQLEAIEEMRGELAAYALIGFGFAYGAWGLRQALRRRPHEHTHAHADGTVHAHVHTHHAEHLHVHEGNAGRVTPWMLFSIFLLGPCEPMIPLLMLPASAGGWKQVTMVAVVFSVVTLVTMVALVLAAHAGMRRLRVPRLERFAHALAGGATFACGLAIYLLGV